MYCGNCFRDNALAGALRRQGHQALLIPLYLPMTLDAPDQSLGTPVFFGGISVYLEQRSAWFRNLPAFARRWLSHPALLRWASGKAAKTQAADVGDLTVSMLRGEQGFQASELDALIAWLRTQPKPDVISLSNVMLVGLARRLRSEINAPVYCMMQGEDAFLDGLPEPFRSQAWTELASRIREVDYLAAPTRYFAEHMARRMNLPPDRVQIIANGINVQDYHPNPHPRNPPVVGFFARQCPEKGLDLLVEAFIRLQTRAGMGNVRLKIGGSHGPSHAAFVEAQKRKLGEAGLLDRAEFHPNLDRASKIRFYESLSVFSVPAHYGEAFGLYLAEAWAAGVPVVQPKVASFPELIEASGGGVLCEPRNSESLAEGLARLINSPEEAVRLGASGRTYAERCLTEDAMAERLVRWIAPQPKSSPSPRAPLSPALS